MPAWLRKALADARSDCCRAHLRSECDGSTQQDAGRVPPSARRRAMSRSSRPLSPRACTGPARFPFCTAAAKAARALPLGDLSSSELRKHAFHAPGNAVGWPVFEWLWNMCRRHSDPHGGEHLADPAAPPSELGAVADRQRLRRRMSDSRCMYRGRRRPGRPDRATSPTDLPRRSIEARSVDAM
jgi:hypothetical protein